MSDTTERIWIPEEAPGGGDPDVFFTMPNGPCTVEYVRADLYDALEQALEKIADPATGYTFRLDRLEHAHTVIEEMREIADRALNVATR